MRGIDGEVLPAPCTLKCETLVLTNIQPPTSLSLIMCQARLPPKIASTNSVTLKGLIAWLAPAHMYVQNMLKVIT